MTIKELSEHVGIKLSNRTMCVFGEMEVSEFLATPFQSLWMRKNASRNTISEVNGLFDAILA